VSATLTFLLVERPAGVEETIALGARSTPRSAQPFLRLRYKPLPHQLFPPPIGWVSGLAEAYVYNFATYIVLQFGKEQARRLIVGAAWAWRA
jgi:hypothetical protein